MASENNIQNERINAAFMEDQRKRDEFGRPVRGGLSARVWSEPVMQEYVRDQVPAFGWVGHSLRTDKADKIVESELRRYRHGLRKKGLDDGLPDDEWIATVLTWKWGRHLGDELSGASDDAEDIRRHVKIAIGWTARDGFY